MTTKKKPRARPSTGRPMGRPVGSGKGYVLAVPPVHFRVTPDQRKELEEEAAARETSVGDVARGRCFPGAR